MRFRNDSDEHACGKRVPGELSHKYDDLGGIACLRTDGHAGECVAISCDAAAADGVCFGCRMPLGGPPRADCEHREAHGRWPTAHESDCPFVRGEACRCPMGNL